MQTLNIPLKNNERAKSKKIVGTEPSNRISPKNQSTIPVALWLKETSIDLPIFHMKGVNKTSVAVASFDKLLQENQESILTKSLSNKIVKRVEDLLIVFVKANKLLQSAVDSLNREVQKKAEKITSLEKEFSEKEMQLHATKNLLDELITRSYDFENQLKEKDAELLLLRQKEAQQLNGKYSQAEDLTPTSKLEMALSQEEVQSRRDQVREMVAKEAPIEQIPLYMGKRAHGEAVTFFKTHYAPYIARGQEVIFAPELMKIDHSLLLALRNECRTSACLIPIGTVSDRTDALMQGRFVDGKHSLRAARAAASVRAFREKQQEKDKYAEFA